MTFDKVPELLSRGHHISEKRLGLIEQRAEFSQYLILPTQFSFPKVVRIMSLVIGFVSKMRKNMRMVGQLLSEGQLWFTVFQTSIITSSNREDNMDNNQVGVAVSEQVGELLHGQELVQYYAKALSPEQREIFNSVQVIRDDAAAVVTPLPEDKYINQALLYLYRKGTKEVKHFMKENKIMKIAVEKEGVLLSSGRLLEEMNFRETSELPELNLGSLGVKINLPVIERFSPLAYSLADHIHWDLARRKGTESCNRISLENVSIVQGATLYKELGEDCIVCKKKRKKHLEAAMGPISDSQLNLAPPCWMVQADLFGPMNVFVPGFEKNTRNRKVLEAQCWVMTVVCPTTRLVNLQVLESTKSAGWIDGFTRLACEVGVPSHVFLDQDSAGMSAFRNAEYELRDLKLQLHKETGISFTVCAVGGHDRHGHVERIVRSVQESLEDCGLKQKIIHATGLQTLCKLVENQYNNLPLGYHYSRAADNTPLLKILTPNMLRVGRSNKRSLDGPIRLPASRMELLAKVEETYMAWYKVWLETLVPKLMFTPKWYHTDKELKQGDLVYFRKKESELDGKWIIGLVDDVERGRDNIIRMVTVKYYNGHQKTPEFTLRTIRKLVKLWDIDETSLADDLAEMHRKFGPIARTVTGDQLEVADNDMTDNDGDGAHAEHINQSILQDTVADDGGHEDHQGAVGGALHEAQVEASAQLAELRDQTEGLGRQCTVCCCTCHHKYSLHYKGNKFMNLPSDLTEEVPQALAMQFDRDQDFQTNCETVFGLEDLVMSTTMDLKAWV